MYRGHDIECLGGYWFYKDTGGSVQENPSRACGFCGRSNTPEGHDGCLGTIPKVLNACCGHGKDKEAYIQFSDGPVLRGQEAIEVFKIRGREIC